MIMTRKCQFRHNLFKLLVRPFSSTCSRKGDPLGFMTTAFIIPYTPSLINNPLAGAFILLMGMAGTLFFLVTSLPEACVQDTSLAFILERLDRLLLLLERFLVYEQSGINILADNLNNFTPDILYRIYLSLQELVLVRESLFNHLSNLVELPIIEFLPGPLVDRINQDLEDLRSGGNNLMALMRSIEIRLNVTDQERIPDF